MPPVTADSTDDAYEERAAIMEFDGGLTRAEAEREARKLHPKAEPLRQAPLLAVR